MKSIGWSRRATVAAALATLATVVATPLPATAQDFPTKPITIVVPFGPGSANDTIARQIAQEMTKTLGQSVTVENRAGAAGNIGVEYVAKSKADGYTLVIASMSNIISQATGNAPFDLTKDFAPVAFAGKAPYSMLVPNGVPAKTVAEFVDFARKQPGKLNYAGFVGGVPQYLGEMLNRAAKIETVMIPYKSTPDALTDLLAERIQIWFTPIASGLPVQRNNQARMLAMTGEARSQASLRVPTFKELGYPDMTVEIAYFLLAAKGTPPAVAEKLHGAIDKALQTGGVQSALIPLGIEEKRGTPAQVGTYLGTELKRWTEIVKLSPPAK